MNTPTRREFFTYAVAATLASGCKTDQTKTDQTKKGPTVLSLVVDVIGPMAFRSSGPKFELWMPKVTYPHQAGIVTSVTGVELPKDDYEITGPSGSTNPGPPYPTGGGQVYPAHVANTSAQNRFIKMLLPKPNLIVVLEPLSARIYPTGSPPPSTYELFAVGVQLRYDNANEPILYDSMGVSPLVPGGKIQFDPPPGEVQLHMLIGYAAFDSTDSGHKESKLSFNELSKLFGLDLQLDFDPAPLSNRFRVKPYYGPLHDCKSCVICVC